MRKKQAPKIYFTDPQGKEHQLCNPLWADDHHIFVTGISSVTQQQTTVHRNECYNEPKRNNR